MSVCLSDSETSLSFKKKRKECEENVWIWDVCINQRNEDCSFNIFCDFLFWGTLVRGGGKHYVTMSEKLWHSVDL